MDAIALELGQEARAAVNPLAFWKTKQQRMDYIAQHAQDRILAARKEWTDRKEAFETAQTERIESLETARSSALDWLQKAIDGDPDYITETTVQRLKDLDLPLELKLELSFDVPTLAVSVSFDPEKTFLQERPSTLKAGWLRIKPIPKKDLLSVIDQFTPELGRVLAAASFDVSPAVRTVRTTFSYNENQLTSLEFTRD